MKSNFVPVLCLILAVCVAACTSPLRKPDVEADSMLYTMMRERDFGKLLEARDLFVRQGLTASEKSWLENHTNNVTYIGLSDYGNLFIPSRVASGDMKFQTDGVLSQHDLFTVGGRSQWLLRVFETKNSDAQWRYASGAGVYLDEW